MHPNTYQSNMDICVCQASFIQYIVHSVSISFGMLHTVKMDKKWSQECCPDISHWTDQKWYFRRLVFVCFCDLLYLSKAASCIFTTVTSVKPLREGVTLLPSPFCCCTHVSFEKEGNWAQIFISVKAEKESSSQKFFLYLGVDVFLSCVLCTLLHNLPVVRDGKPGERELET